MSNHQADAVNRRRTSQEIQLILQQYRESGATAASFCQQHGLNEGTLHTWRKRYRVAVESAKPTGSFVKVQVNDTMLPALFAEVRGIRLYQPVSPAFLISLLS